MKDLIIVRLSDAKEMLSDRSTNRKIGAVVSIVDPDRSYPRHLDEDLRPVLKLKFYDLEDGMSVTGYDPPPQREHVQQIIDFAPSVKHIEGTLLVHCMMGQSRSPAAAYIITAINMGKGHEEEALAKTLRSAESRYASPNRRMVRLADEILGDGWNLLKAME